MRGTAWTIAAAAGLAAPIAAQDAGRASDRALAPLVQCRGIADPRARASCYDGALDQLQGAVAARQVVVVDHEQMKQDRRSLFGFSGDHTPPAPKPPKAPKAARVAAAPSEAVTEIDTTIVSASPRGEFWVLKLATGATWRTTESSNIVVAPKPGTKVRVHKSLMGGFFVRVGTARAVRAIRVS